MDSYGRLNLGKDQKTLSIYFWDKTLAITSAIKYSHIGDFVIYGIHGKD
jgi:hypothetical protein